jgi:hypothetical protein
MPNFVLISHSHDMEPEEEDRMSLEEIIDEITLTGR